jgi:hypothetical protein
MVVSNDPATALPSHTEKTAKGASLNSTRRMLAFGSSHSTTRVQEISGLFRTLLPSYRVVALTLLPALNRQCFDWGNPVQ